MHDDTQDSPRTRSPDSRPIIQRPLTCYLALALSLMVLFAIFIVPVFRVNRVVVVANSGSIPVARIVEASRAQGQNIFELRSSDILSRVEAVPEVAVTQVDISLPGTVTIHASARRAVLIWTQAKASFAVDNQGRVLYPVQHSQLPRVRAFVRGNVRPGQFLDPSLVLAVTYTHRVLRRAGLTGYIVGEKRGLILESDRGWSAVLGRPGPRSLVERVATLQSLLGNASTGRHLTFIDLRYSTPFAR